MKRNNRRMNNDSKVYSVLLSFIFNIFPFFFYSEIFILLSVINRFISANIMTQRGKWIIHTLIRNTCLKIH